MKRFFHPLDSRLSLAFYMFFYTLVKSPLVWALCIVGIMITTTYLVAPPFGTQRYIEKHK